MSSQSFCFYGYPLGHLPPNRQPHHYFFSFIAGSECHMKSASSFGPILLPTLELEVQLSFMLGRVAGFQVCSSWDVWFLKVFISYWSITDLQSLSESDAQRSDSPMHIHVCVRATRFSCIWLFVTLWTITRQAPLSMGFSRQGYWRGLPFPSLGDLPHPGVELPVSRGLLPWQRPSLPSCRVFNMGAPQTY